MIFRAARHTNNIDKIISFYTKVLGFEILGQFKGHEGYDGIFIGPEGADWHLEFTTSQQQSEQKYNENDILVFYPTTTDEYGAIIYRIKKNNIAAVKPRNPYWAKNGIMVTDPDGFNVVISYLRAKQVKKL